VGYLWNKVEINVFSLSLVGSSAFQEIMLTRDVVSGQVIKACGLSGVEIASGAEVSGALELVLSAAETTVSRQLALKL
jgi:hypothetical protein